MKLLFEQVQPKDVSFNDMEVICEQTNPKEPTKLKIRGKYICCDKTNANGRIYKFNYMNTKCVPDYKKIWVDQKRAYAQLNHCQSYVVDPKLACELITSLQADGTDFIGESIVLNSDTRLGTPGTPNGDILAAILVHGGKIGKSTRGAVDDPSNKVIDENNQYSIITVDTVLDPSGPGCYVNDIVMQQKDFMVNQHGIVVECAYNTLQKNMDKVAAKNILDEQKKRQQMMSIFSQFMADIRKK